MKIALCADRHSLARAAASEAAAIITEAIARRGNVRIVAATGSSQFDFLEELTQSSTIDWTLVEMFHLDEYLGISIQHPASFRKYLLDRLINKVGIRRYHLLDGERDPSETISAVTSELCKSPIDVAFVGIGENGHIAFNDPPADFETKASYIVVELDEECRRQQLEEGWFNVLEDVPRRAISMTVSQILESRRIICVVPDARKAHAVANCLEGRIDPMVPASILRTHSHTCLYLDKSSSSLLKPETLRNLDGFAGR